MKFTCKGDFFSETEDGVRGTELGSLTTANFCFFTWKMTNILSDSVWNQCVYFFHFSPSLYFTVRATAYHNTWHFKEKSQKIQIFADQQCWKQLLMKCKGIMYRRRVFSLDSTFKLIFNEKSSTRDKMLHLILLLGMYSPRKSC